MQSLVVTPKPYKTESFWGYLIRVTEQNGYEAPSTLLLHSGYDELVYLPLSGEPFQNLLKLLNKSEFELRELAYYAFTEPRSLAYKILDHHLSKSFGHNFLNLRRPRFCLDCVLEDGYIDAFWDLELAFYCPRHNKLPITECNVCRSRVTHMRPGLLICKCGDSYEANETSEVTIQVSEMMQIIWAKLHRIPLSCVQNESKYDLDAIEKMSLRSLFKLIILLPRLKFNYSRNKRKADLDMVSNACEILAHWPIGFHTLMKEVGQRQLELLGENTSLCVCLGPVYKAFFTQGAFDTEIDFIRNEYIYFGLNLWDGKKKEPSNDPNKKARYVSGSELAIRCGVSFKTVKLWIKKGRIKLKHFGTGTGGRYLVDLETVNLPDPNETKVIGEFKAAEAIGVSIRLFRTFKASGDFAFSNDLSVTGDYALSDLLRVRQKFIDLSEPIAPAHILDPEMVMRFETIFAKNIFYSFECKTRFIKEYLNGKIKSYGRIGDSVKDIYFDKKVLSEFCTQFKKQFEVEQGIIGHVEASKLIGAHEAIPSALVRGGVLPVITCGKRVGIDRKAFLKFASKYVFLPVVAKQGFTTLPRLIQLCKQFEFKTLQGKTNAGITFVFIEKADSKKLLNLHETIPVPINLLRKQRRKRRKALGSPIQLSLN